jgi:hypothetical protein
MTHRTHVRRALAAALLTVTMFAVFPALTASAASSSTTTARYSYVPHKICPIDWRKGPWHVKKLIRCAAHRWQVPGGARTALRIANRESHFRPRAYNAYSGAAGIFQHLLRYWPGRAYTYGFKRWSAFNARANIIVTMRMVKRTGWSPWSTY